MANDLNNLLDRVTKVDPALARDLRAHVAALLKRREFGLVFESHQPETVELNGRAVRRGDKVRFLPARGSDEKVPDDRWLVENMSTQAKGENAKAVAQLRAVDDGRTTERAVEDLVVVADFRDPIYPGLNSTGKIERGGDKPFHTVINAENFHALETLLFTDQGKVDAIYIDPPYNTRANDWKYNNNYVQPDHEYKHSMWLAMMERRLKLARKLLNPESSVLIVTIDEKEHLRLGLLLEQTFPEARIQMITSSIKPSGSRRGSEFSRVEEFIFFLMFGAVMPASTPNDMLRNDGAEPSEQVAVTWHGLRRRGSTDWKRSHRPNCFYPLFVSKPTGELVGVGEPLALEDDRDSVTPPEGTVAVWPLAPDGAEGRWQVATKRFRKQHAEGTLALSSVDLDAGSASVVYLKSGDLKKIATDEVTVRGRLPDGRVDVVTDSPTSKRPKTMWVVDSHDASTYGTALLSRFIGDREFPFPKSLYAVEDTLRFFVKDKPQALILDFFVGSGTTTHAVARLNRQDGGRRRSVVVTNNEVSADEAASLRSRALRPCDPEWEEFGIFEHIAKPRITAAITGRTPEGEPVQGDYKFVDESPMSEGFDENVEFFTLTYEDPELVGLDLAFERVAPLLWMRAGSEGPRIEQRADTFAVADTYAVLFDPDASRGFLTAISEAKDLKIAFIVTDDEKQFQMVAAHLPPSVEAVRLYESYLRTLEINTGKE